MRSYNHNPFLLLALANIQAAVLSYLKGLETEALLDVVEANGNWWGTWPSMSGNSPSVQSEVKEDREAKIPLFEVSLQLWRLNLTGLWKVQRRLVLFLPTGDISTPSSPLNNLYTCLHPMISAAHQWAAPSTVTFPQAPVAPLHLPISSSAVPLFPSPELYSSFCTHPFGLCPTGTKITAETRLMCGSMFPPSSTLPTQMVRVWSRVCSYWYCLCCNLAPWHSRFS